MGALTKADLAEQLHRSIGLNKREAKDFVEHFFEEFRVALAEGREVKIAGLGYFRLSDKKQRPGRNPKTKQDVPVSARRVVTFKASQSLKQLVAKCHPEKD